MHMNSVQIVNKSEPYIYDEEKLNIRLNYSSKIRCKKTTFRAIVFNSLHMSVGMAATSYDMITEEGNNCIDFEISLPNLAEGNFSLRIVLYEVDEYGDEIIHDVVDIAFLFSKITTSHKNNTSKNWKNQVWGSIEFPTIKFKSNIE